MKKGQLVMCSVGTLKLKVNHRLNVSLLLDMLGTYVFDTIKSMKDDIKYNVPKDLQEYILEVEGVLDEHGIFIEEIASSIFVISFDNRPYFIHESLIHEV